MGERILFALEVDSSRGQESVKALSRDVGDLDTKAKAASASGAGLNKQMDGIKGSASQAREGMAALAGALNVLDPALGKTVSQLGAATGAVQSFGSAGKLLGLSITTGGILFVAVGVFAGIWKVLADEVERAEQKMKSAASTASQMQGISKTVSDQRLQTAFATGAISKEEFTMTQATAKGEALFGPQIAAAQSELDAIPKTIGTRGQRGAKANEIANLQKGMANYIADLVEEALAEPPKITKTGGGGAPKIDPGWIGPHGETEQQAFRLRELQTTTTSEFMSGTNVSGMTVNAEWRGDPTTPMGTSNWKDGKGALAGLGDAMSSRYGQGFGALASGNAAAAFGALGPVGGALGGIAGIGALGADGVKEKLFSFKDDLIAGFQELPGILIDVIPEFVTALVTELPPAIGKAVWEAMNRRVSTADEAQGKVDKITKSDGFFQITGHRDNGGSIPTAGIYAHEEGEFIAPRNGTAGASTSRAVQAMNIGGTHLDLRGAVLGDGFSREVNKVLDRLGPMGMGHTTASGITGGY